MKVVSFFSGCGGLDLGFEQAGFDVVWANDIDPTVYATYKLNHPHTFLCKKDMRLCLQMKYQSVMVLLVDRHANLGAKVESKEAWMTREAGCFSHTSTL